MELSGAHSDSGIKETSESSGLSDPMGRLADREVRLENYRCHFTNDRIQTHRFVQVEDLLESQSSMLRRVVASNAVLREEWRRSKEKLLLCPEVRFQ